jgi:hypothetical protein
MDKHVPLTGACEEKGWGRPTTAGRLQRGAQAISVVSRLRQCSLYTYHIHLFKPSHAPFCSSHTKIRLRSSNINTRCQHLAKLQLTFFLGEHDVRSGTMSTSVMCTWGPTELKVELLAGQTNARLSIARVSCWNQSCGSAGVEIHRGLK